MRMISRISELLDLASSSPSLLELLGKGADPNTMTLSILARECRSTAMLQLLAEFGMSYKSGDDNILG